MNNNIFAFSETAQGYNHIKVNKVCEDASDFYSDERMHICVVADGHGSDNYPRTDRGSRFAVDSAISCAIEFVNAADAKDVLNDKKNKYGLMLQLATSILNKWHQAIEDDYSKHPFVETEMEKVSDKYKKRYFAQNPIERSIEKAYGCTLILFVVTQEYSFGMQIGDGKCVVVDKDGNFAEPIPWDDDCQMNVTTSICDGDAIEEFRFYITDKTPTAVFCGTDGIDDSYASSEELYALYRSILKIFIEHGAEVGKSEIAEYLPVLTKRGSGDDVSIGLILDLDRAKIIEPILEAHSEMYKLSQELKEKQHQANVIDEKTVMLSKKVRKWLESGKATDAIIDDVKKVQELKIQKDELGEEITSIEKRLTNLNESLECTIFDNEVASFDTATNTEISKKLLTEVNSEELEKTLTTITETIIEMKERNEDTERTCEDEEVISEQPCDSEIEVEAEDSNTNSQEEA